ncbi:MAG: response regulator [Candidatus Omnitrophica bacterium]|nr:response regulator [Candidatus Omnitrophota bacterium]
MLDFLRRFFVRRKRKQILVIDDEPHILKTVTTALKGEGYIVHSALSGKEGLNLAKVMRPHLIILDIMMPPPDGIAVYKELKDHAFTRRIPVLFMTAKAEKQVEYLGITDPILFRHHIKKPFSIRNLLERVRAILSATP